MRLVNADELVEALDEASKKQTDNMDGVRKQLLVGFAKQILSDTLTVKAIPIEWIDGYIKRRVNDAEIYAEILFISDMVTEWEKENETN